MSSPSTNISQNMQTQILCEIIVDRYISYYQDLKKKYLSPQNPQKENLLIKQSLLPLLLNAKKVLKGLPTPYSEDEKDLIKKTYKNLLEIFIKEGCQQEAEETLKNVKDIIIKNYLKQNIKNLFHH
jgi:hypothetical protein